MTDKKLINAWQKAAVDLKLNIQTPFVLNKINGGEIKCLLLIENFGSKKGTLILSTDDMDDFDEPEKYGYYCSALNPFHYSKYNRDGFVETLIDWGFYGKEDEKPTWYNGVVY
jgi:hypothetical protein